MGPGDYEVIAWACPTSLTETAQHRSRTCTTPGSPSWRCVRRERLLSHKKRVRPDCGLTAQPLIDRREIRLCRPEKIIKGVDDKIGLLKRVNLIFGSHHAFEVKCNSAWSAVQKAIARLGTR